MYDIITSHFNKLYNKFSSRDRPNYNFPLLIPLANINYTWAIDPGAGYFWLGMIWGAIWERVYRYKCTHYMISQAVYYHKYCILQLYRHRYCMYSSIGTYISTLASKYYHVNIMSQIAAYHTMHCTWSPGGKQVLLSGESQHTPGQHFHRSPCKYLLLKNNQWLNSLHL